MGYTVPYDNDNLGLSVIKSVSGSRSLGIVQYCLPGLAAQTISGTVKGQCRGNESNADADAYLDVIIKIWDPVGGTFRGTLKNFTGSGNELSTSTTNRFLPVAGTSLSSVTAQQGDWLIIEYGAAGTGLLTPRTLQCNFANQSTNTADLPEDEIDTSSVKNSWIEFSQTLQFKQTMDLADADFKDSTDIFDKYYVRINTGPNENPQIVGQTWPRGAGRG